LLQAQPNATAAFICFESAAALGKKQTCAAALMTVKSLIRQPWQIVYCQLKFEYSD